jgi:hypothetical protein
LQAFARLSLIVKRANIVSRAAALVACNHFRRIGRAGVLVVFIWRQGNARNWTGKFEDLLTPNTSRSLYFWPGLLVLLGQTKRTPPVGQRRRYFLKDEILGQALGWPLSSACSWVVSHNFNQNVLAICAPMAYICSMEIVETTLFTKRVKSILSEAEYRRLQSTLVRTPETGTIIPGSGGLRKIRWSGSGRGKSGGSRTIYYWARSADTIVMLFIFSKNERVDLSKEQLAALRALVEREYK